MRRILIVVFLAVVLNVETALGSEDREFIKLRNLGSPAKEDVTLLPWFQNSERLIRAQAVRKLSPQIKNGRWPVIAFRLDSTGKPINFVVITSSGLKAVDRKVINCISSVKKFPLPNNSSPFYRGLIFRASSIDSISLKLFWLRYVPNFFDRLDAGDKAIWRSEQRSLQDHTPGVWH